MSRGSRLALLALAVALMLAPVATVHPAVTHLYAAGLSNLSIEFSHPRVFAFLTLALVSALPAVGFLFSLIRTARGVGDLRQLTRTSTPARLDGLCYRVLPSDAERELGYAELRAALLHERAHQLNRDVLWRLLLRATGRAFPFLPWVANAVETETLRTECEADDYAIRNGARRRELFEAIAAAALPPAHSPAAGVTGANVELRLTRLVCPETPLPQAPTRSFLALAAGLVLPAVVAHLVAVGAAVGTSHLMM
ncbi:MAG: hypothetical protein L6Q80_06885 [Dehalococcoidia bacterium]|nr:hypothetical protein [Dehalococcoidia bacterium]